MEAKRLTLQMRAPWGYQQREPGKCFQGCLEYPGEYLDKHSVLPRVARAETGLGRPAT